MTTSGEDVRLPATKVCPGTYSRPRIFAPENKGQCRNCRRWVPMIGFECADVVDVHYVHSDGDAR